MPYSVVRLGNDVMLEQNGDGDGSGTVMVVKKGVVLTQRAPYRK